MHNHYIDYMNDEHTHVRVCVCVSVNNVQNLWGLDSSLANVKVYWQNTQTRSDEKL